jgi:Ca2+-binding RTX toxin-like protein
MRRSLLACILLALCAAPAQAATVSQTLAPYVEPPNTPPEESCSRYSQCPSGVVTAKLAAAAGERNDVTVLSGNGALVFTDAGTPLIAGPGCGAQPDGSVSCPYPAVADAISTLELALGDGDDSARLVGGLGATISGGAGADTIRGGGGFDEIAGGAGDDTILGRGAGDLLRGGTGRDVIRGGAGADTIGARDGERDTVAGGRGRDTARVDRRDRVRSVERARVR